MALPSRLRDRASWTTQEGFKWMGVTMIVMTMPLIFLHFPMWGSMLLPGNPDETSEVDYYMKVGRPSGFMEIGGGTSVICDLPA